MKRNIVRKRIIIWAIVVISLAIIYIVPVLAQGVSFRYWRKLGFPNAIQVLKYKIDPYPGHSLECLRFPDTIMKDAKDDMSIEYTEKGSGIDTNGYVLHIGDSREHVMDEFYYFNPEGNGSHYELGCFYCETDFFLIFNFAYDANDILTKMTIQKKWYNREE